MCVSGSKSEVEFLPSIKGYPYEWFPSSATSSNAVGDNGRDDPLREGTILLFPTLLRFRCNKTWDWNKRRQKLLRLLKYLCTNKRYIEAMKKC